MFALGGPLLRSWASSILFRALQRSAAFHLRAAADSRDADPVLVPRRSPRTRMPVRSSSFHGTRLGTCRARSRPYEAVHHRDVLVAPSKPQLGRSAAAPAQRAATRTRIVYSTGRGPLPGACISTWPAKRRSCPPLPAPTAAGSGHLRPERAAQLRVDAERRLRAAAAPASGGRIGAIRSWRSGDLDRVRSGVAGARGDACALSVVRTSVATAGTGAGRLHRPLVCVDSAAPVPRSRPGPAVQV